MLKIGIYDKWNGLKKSLQIKENVRYFKERQIWWCNIGQNLGLEVYGKGEIFTRPVLIYKKLSSNLFFGIPFTTKPKMGNWYIRVMFQGKPSFAMLNQCRVFDKKRLVDKIGQLNNDDFCNIKTGFNSLFK